MLLISAVLALGDPKAASAQEKPLLANVFQDNMVLQRNVPAPVWGWASPGTQVTVEVAGKRASGVADATGRWMAKLPPLPVGGPYSLKVTGPETRELTNILVGDVWVCSGQSNMEQGVAISADPEKEIAAADYPQIRLLTVAHQVALSPQDTFVGRWAVCSPKTIASGGWGGFSATAYYFGRELNTRLKIPIGLIHTSWGGTIAEAWTSEEALNGLEDFRPRVAQVVAERANRTTPEEFRKQVADWWARNDPGMKGDWRNPETADADWKTMALPGPWEDRGLPGFDGIVWFRRTVEVPGDVAGKEAVLRLGPIDDRDVTFVNGVRVGSTDLYNIDREYKIPAGTLKPGRNVIAVSVLDTGGAGGLVGMPENLSLSFGGDSTISLAGDWKYQVGEELKKLPPLPARIGGEDPNVSTVLYNGMVAPLIPLAIKGAIWYQGESNAGRAFQYRSLLPTLIRDWRRRFGVGEFPFYIVQLANWQARQTQPGDDAWAELREAQAMTARTVGNSGMAVTIDIGEAEDIHPKNKQDVGKRLALQALKKTYGQKNLVASGPVYTGMTKANGEIRLKFDEVGGGLIVRGGALEGFAIAGQDRRWVWAEARIDGRDVVVSSSKVPEPVAVRYAWGINPLGNLFNAEGLPASPFRTDDWPGITVNNR
ncbi:MAG: sialate O-acetylesterase [Capsulimonadales bacterium]|nr:sialate O-acetylesterase [Capsulimonadales bacterium]